MDIIQSSLANIAIGRKARVTSLKCDGKTRRRMLDLGIIEGTEIEPLYKGLSGNTVAYLIRGAVIALRSDISEKIIVSVQ